jgi:hypothetical protein
LEIQVFLVPTLRVMRSVGTRKREVIYIESIAYGNRMNSVAAMKNLLKQVNLPPNNVFLTRFSSQAANSFADIELPNALIS